MIEPTATMPTEAPTTVPATVTPAEAPMVEPANIPAVKPDVWEMPNEGSGWCDCGEDHPVGKPPVGDGRDVAEVEVARGQQQVGAVAGPEVDGARHRQRGAFLVGDAEDRRRPRPRCIPVTGAHPHRR